MLNVGKLKQAVALTMISTMIGTSMPVLHANAAGAPAQTPEMTLLIESLMISGKKMSNRELKAELGEAMVNYNQTAPAEGREERLADALVQTGIMTPDRAEAFRQSIQDAVASELAQNKGNPQAAISQALVSALGRTEGAQFSNCALNGIATVLLTAGLVGSIIAYDHMTKDDYSYSYYEDGQRVTVESYNEDAALPLLGIIFTSIGLVFSTLGLATTC